MFGQRRRIETNRRYVGDFSSGAGSSLVRMFGLPLHHFRRSRVFGPEKIEHIATVDLGTEVGRPRAAPSDPKRTTVSSSAPRPSAPRQSKRSGTPLVAVASALAAALATAVAMQTGFLDGVFAKLLALLKLNVFPPVSVGQPQETVEVVDCSVFAVPSAPAGRSMFVQVFLHAPEQLDRAEGIARRASFPEPSASPIGSSRQPIANSRNPTVTCVA